MNEQADFGEALRAAETALRERRYPDAETRLRELLAVAPGGPRRALVLDALGRCLHEQERPTEARSVLEEAVHILQAELGPHQATAVTLQHLSRVCGAASDAEACLRHGQAAVDVLTRLHGADHPLVASALFSLSHTIYAARRYDEAEAMVRRAMAVWEAALGPECPELGACYNNLGRICEERGQAAEGIALHRRAVALRRKVLGEHPETAFSLGNLGTALAAAGQWEEAATHLEAAVACYLACGYADAPEIPGYRRNLRLCREAL